MNFLSDTLVSTKRAVQQRRSTRSLEEVKASVPVRSDDRVFLSALQKEGRSLIAEFKRLWPSASKQDLLEDPNLEQIVRAYELGGARAISVLTEERNFGGSHQDLHLARQACSLPILDKDFIVDEYQVYEAAAAHADAILLIAAALKDEGDLLRCLHDLAREIHLDVLVEVRDEDEIGFALEVGADLIGINNRDLGPRTLDIDLGTTQRLIDRIPSGVTIVSESGLRSPEDIAGLDDRVAAVLVGAALMTADDPQAKCRELVQAGADTGKAARKRAADPAFA